MTLNIPYWANIYTYLGLYVPRCISLYSYNKYITTRDKNMYTLAMGLLAFTGLYHSTLACSNLVGCNLVVCTCDFKMVLWPL